MIVSVSALLIAACGGPAPTSAPAVGPATTNLPRPEPSPAIATFNPAATIGQPTLVPPPLPPGVVSSSAPSVPPATPAPTSPLPGTTALVLPTDAGVTTIALGPIPPGSAPGQYPPKSGGTPTGPYVYLGADPVNQSAYRLSVVDLSGGSVRYVPLPSRPAESVAYALVTGGRLVVLLRRQEGWPPEQLGMPCSSSNGRPITWRLLVARLGSDGLPAQGWWQVDAGVATRPFTDPNAGVTCHDPLVPPVTVAGDAGSLVAYATDHPSAAYSAGSRIVLRSLASGTVERVIDTATTVTALALSATSVAWVESPDADAPGPVTRWRVMRAPVGTGVASEVPLAVPGRIWRYAPQNIMLDGDAVLTNPGARVIGWGIAVRSQGSSVVALNPSGSPYCTVFGASLGVAVLACRSEGTDDHVATWSATHGLRVLAEPGPALYRSETVASGYVAWVWADLMTLTRQDLVAVPFGGLIAANR